MNWAPSCFLIFSHAKMRIIEDWNTKPKIGQYCLLKKPLIIAGESLYEYKLSKREIKNGIILERVHNIGEKWSYVAGHLALFKVRAWLPLTILSSTLTSSITSSPMSSFMTYVVPRRHCFRNLATSNSPSSCWPIFCSIWGFRATQMSRTYSFPSSHGVNAALKGFTLFFGDQSYDILQSLKDLIWWQQNASALFQVY